MALADARMMDCCISSDYANELSEHQRILHGEILVLKSFVWRVDRLWMFRWFDLLVKEVTTLLRSYAGRWTSMGFGCFGCV